MKRLRGFVKFWRERGKYWRMLDKFARSYGAPVLFTVWFLILAVRLWHLHLGDRDLRNNTKYRGSLKASRGVIYDRGGNPIAVNQVGWRIFVDPHAENKPRQDPVATSKRIAELTGRKVREVYADLCNTNLSKYVVQGVTFDPAAIDLATNKALYVNGVGLEQIEERVYPQGRRFAHILGFVSGRDPIGQNGGIEQVYEKMLKGTDGFVIGVRANNGPEIRERRITTMDAIDGASVFLTIDQNIQLVAYQALKAAVGEWNANGGRVIVQKVDTGEILAMVSLPDFDPADWKDSEAYMRKNRAVTDQYDPGSTMKAVTVASALNEHLITPHSTYDVGGGLWFYGGKTLRDHATGIIDVRTIIAKSSNIGAAKIALDLGNKRFERYLRAFGFGSRTGIDLPGEGTGMLTPSEKWELIKPTRIAMGQGISVTPIQMVNAYSTIANGGKRMRPYVMQRIISSNGEVIQRNLPKVEGMPIAPAVAKDMREMLALVVSPQGTARRARVPGYKVAGKTGTAQIPKPGGGYYDHNHWASFIGFLPADDPVFSVLVLLDNPTKPGMSHDGGVSAAPVFSEIAAATAQYLEIPIEPPEEEQEP